MSHTSRAKRGILVAIDPKATVCVWAATVRPGKVPGTSSRAGSNGPDEEKHVMATLKDGKHRSREVSAFVVSGRVGDGDLQHGVTQHASSIMTLRKFGGITHIR